MFFVNIKKIKNLDMFLENGHYFFSKGFDVAKKQEYMQSNTFGDKIISKKELLKNYIKKYLYRNGFIINSSSKLFNGIEIIIPSNKYGYKILSETEVCTIYDDIEYMNMIKNNREMIKEYYNVPNVLIEEKKYIVEKKINNTKYNKDDFLRYILNIEEKKELENIDVKDNFTILYKNYKIISKMFDKYNINLNIPCTLQHCDLWDGNVLYNGMYYIIDYENVQKNYFLFDFFMYMYSEYYIYNDISMIEKYFNGNYNKELKVVFEKFQMCFDKNMLKNYFVTFIYIFFNMRFGNNNNKCLKNEKVKINKLLRKFGLEELI